MAVNSELLGGLQQRIKIINENWIMKGREIDYTKSKIEGKAEQKKVIFNLIS